jgi:aminopeptidase N
MKLTLLFFCFLPYLLFAQDTTSFFKEMTRIAETEQKAAAALTSKQAFSGASQNFDVHHYRCEWEINPAVWFIKGTVTPSFRMIQSGNAITLDINSALQVDSVIYHGSKISFTQGPGDIVTIQFPSAIATGVKDSVSIYYKGVPLFTGYGAFYQHQHAGVPVIWTLSEPYGAKYWWPCKDDLVDKADSLDIFITHPAIYTASSIGMVESRQVKDTLATTHFRHRYPIASYLVALAVTNYATDDDTIVVNNKSYRFISYAYPEAVGYFFGQEMYAKDAFRLFVKLFGEYPFANEKYGHTQFGKAGGMEHQTNSFMSNTSPTLSAHELGHQWFGDKVTCGSWSDIWLNEGFATYSSGLYIREYFDLRYYRGFLAETLTSVVSQPGGSVYVYDTTDIARIFSARLSYNKGAYVAHMLRWVLGDTVYFRGLRRYLDDPMVKYGFARTADLQRNLEQESGKNLNSFFQKWVYGEGYPNYQASWSQNANRWAKVKLSQTTSHQSVSFYEMPVVLRFRSATDSADVVVDHKYSGQEFDISLNFVADTIIIDPDIWILSKVKTSEKLVTDNSVDLIQVYPNPAPTDLNFVLQNPTGSRLFVKLFNSAGQLVYRKELSLNGQNIDIKVPMHTYPKGSYIVDVRDDKKLRYVRRIIH